MAKSIVFFDTEISVHENKILDIGAVRGDKTVFHSPSVSEFCAFVAGAEFLCGHNVVHHDMKHIKPHIGDALQQKVIDTLYLSPLMFPRRPYHKLLKDDKGYVPTSSEVRFIVAWKGKNDEQETPIIISDIHFVKE